MRHIALIVAAGDGKRFGSVTGKILAPIMGKPLISYALKKFENFEKIDEIVLVIRAKDYSIVEQEVIKKSEYKKVKHIIAGGSSRQESVYKGLMTIKEKDGIVFIHDGARPIIEEWLIADLIKMIEYFNGVIPAVPIVETIKKVINSKMLIDETMDRNKYWLAQTPQVFRLKKIKEFYHRAMKENIQFTDDSSIAEYYGEKVIIIPGSYSNIKITTEDDLYLAEALIKKYYF